MVFDTLVSVADTVAYTSCVKLFIASEVEVDIICILLPHSRSLCIKA